MSFSPPPRTVGEEGGGSRLGRLVLPRCGAERREELELLPRDEPLVGARQEASFGNAVKVAKLVEPLRGDDGVSDIIEHEISSAPLWSVGSDERRSNLGSVTVARERRRRDSNLFPEHYNQQPQQQ